jgi:3'(2'), 5'-bisphosphate nucleotidase
VTERTVVDFDLLSAWANRLVPVAEAAGRAILEVQRGDIAVNAKADSSPVTAADEAAEAIILEALDDLAPRFPIVAEEQVAGGQMPTLSGDDFWLIDPLDGTKEFINKRSDFTVNIGFVHRLVPALGIVHTPARNETYVGIICGGRHRAELRSEGKVRPISVRPRPAQVIVAGSKSHEVPEKMDAFLAKYQVADRVVIGSSLKFCLVAEGKADLYPRFGPTCEWDTAAAHAVLRAAGGRVHTFDGKELQYKKPQFLNGAFLADAGA